MAIAEKDLPETHPPVPGTGDRPSLRFIKFPPPLRIYSNGAERERDFSRVNEEAARGYEYETTCMNYLIKVLPSDYFVIGPNILDLSLGKEVEESRTLIPDFLIFRKIGDSLVLKGAAEVKVRTINNRRTKKLESFARLLEVFRKNSSGISSLLTENIGRITTNNEIQVPDDSRIEFAFISPRRPSEPVTVPGLKFTVFYLQVPESSPQAVGTAALGSGFRASVS